MTIAVRSLLRGSLLLVLLAGSVVWTSCDIASAGSTAILNADSPIPPTVRYRFAFTESDATGEEGEVVVESEPQSNDLDAVLSENLGANRSDVVSARIDSVLVERVSPDALTEAELFLGTSAEAPLIASVEFQPDGPSSVVDDRRTTVTGAVRNGVETIVGRFHMENVRSGLVRAKVYYRLEVENV